MELDEKVLKGLEACKVGECTDCPYNKVCANPILFQDLATDTLELLNKLKPVTPTVFMAGGWWKCPTCGKYSIPVSAHYCFNCGQAVILEEMQKNE